MRNRKTKKVVKGDKTYELVASAKPSGNKTLLDFVLKRHKAYDMHRSFEQVPLGDKLYNAAFFFMDQKWSKFRDLKTKSFFKKQEQYDRKILSSIKHRTPERG